MTEFGQYSLTYNPGPPDPYSGVLEHSVEMTISGEADLQQLLTLFESFLRANGFVFEGEVQIVEGEEAFDKQYWQEKYLELLRSPSETVSHYNVTCQGSQGVDFVPFSSSVADDLFTSGLE